jgi:hypothetical protein
LLPGLRASDGRRDDLGYPSPKTPPGVGDVTMKLARQQTGRIVRDGGQSFSSPFAATEAAGASEGRA